MMSGPVGSRGDASAATQPSASESCHSGLCSAKTKIALKKSDCTPNCEQQHPALMSPQPGVRMRIVAAAEPLLKRKPTKTYTPEEFEEEHKSALAARYAAAHPDRVSRLVLVAPAQSNATVAAGLTMPTLLLWARDDAMVRVHHADAYAKHAPKLTRHTVRKGGHRVLDEYTAAVRDFVLQ